MRWKTLLLHLEEAVKKCSKPSSQTSSSKAAVSSSGGSHGAVHNFWWSTEVLDAGFHGVSKSSLNKSWRWFQHFVLFVYSKGWMGMTTSPGTITHFLSVPSDHRYFPPQYLCLLSLSASTSNLSTWESCVVLHWVPILVTKGAVSLVLVHTWNSSDVLFIWKSWFCRCLDGEMRRQIRQDRREAKCSWFLLL